MISISKSASLKEQATNYLQSEEFKKLIPYLMSGGAGALAGGVLTGRRREERGEGRMGYLGRILRNALITGGLAGGAHYMLGQGAEKTVGNLQDSSKALTGTPGDEGPAATAAKNILFSPVTAAAAGAGALALTHDNAVMGAGNKDDFRKRLSKELGGSRDAAWLRTATPKELADAVAKLKDPTAIESAERLRRAAGLASSRIEPGGHGIGNLLQAIPGVSDEAAAATKGALSTIGRKGLGTFGQNWPRRTGRGALALTAASIPAIIGSLITSDSSPSTT